MSVSITLDSIIHAPDSIRGGAHPMTRTVQEIIEDDFRYGIGRAGTVLQDVIDRAGIDSQSIDEPVYLDTAEVAAHLTLPDIRVLLDDPNATVVSNS